MLFWGLPGDSPLCHSDKMGAAKLNYRAENKPQTTERGGKDWDGGREKGRSGAMEPQVLASQLSGTESDAGEGWDWEGLLAKHNKMPR